MRKRIQDAWKILSSRGCLMRAWASLKRTRIFLGLVENPRKLHSQVVKLSLVYFAKQRNVLGTNIVEQTNTKSPLVTSTAVDDSIVAIPCRGYPMRFVTLLIPYRGYPEISVYRPTTLGKCCEGSATILYTFVSFAKLLIPYRWYPMSIVTPPVPTGTARTLQNLPLESFASKLAYPGPIGSEEWTRPLL